MASLYIPTLVITDVIRNYISCVETLVSKGVLREFELVVHVWTTERLFTWHQANGKMNKADHKVADIVVRKAKKLIREHICPLCNNTMVDKWDRSGTGLWTCLHCDFRIYDHHLYDRYLDFLAVVIRRRIRQRKVKINGRVGGE